MATEFNHNGNIYEIINDEEVRLTMLSDGCRGEVYIPKYARYNDKQYVVTEIGCVEKYDYYRTYDRNASDRRKKSEIVTEVAGSSWASVFRRGYKPEEHQLRPYNKEIISLIIPDTVTKIHSSAFRFCHGLEKLILPNSVTFIGGSAFSECRKLKELILPEGISEIRGYTFWYCQSLVKLTIPNSVRIIGEDAFSGYENETLTRLTIPSSVEEIGSGAFCRYKSLNEVDIYNEPGEVMIAGNAFPSTAKINYLGKKAKKNSDNKAVVAEEESVKANPSGKEKGFFARLADFIKNDDTPQEKEKTASKVKTETKAAPAPKAKVEPKVVETKAKPAPKVKEESKAKVAKPVAKADGGYSKIQVNFHFNSETAEKKVKMTLTKKALDYAVTNGYDALEVAFDIDRIVLRGGGNILLQKVMDKALTITGYEWIE